MSERAFYRNLAPADQSPFKFLTERGGSLDFGTVADRSNLGCEDYYSAGADPEGMGQRGKSFNDATANIENRQLPNNKQMLMQN